MKAKSEGLHLLKLLNIFQKQNELVSNLSGGMKRKLSLAVALVGSPEVSNSKILIVKVLNEIMLINNL